MQGQHVDRSTACMHWDAAARMAIWYSRKEQGHPCRLCMRELLLTSLGVSLWQRDSRPSLSSLLFSSLMRLGCSAWPAGAKELRSYTASRRLQNNSARTFHTRSSLAGKP